VIAQAKVPYVFHFLHTADWQIGRQYGQFDGDDAALLAEARLDAVAAIARLAAERAVDAVLVAGDIFDTQGISDRTIRKLFANLAAYSGQWVMIAGNHDAALTNSVWTRAAELGCITANVHIPLTTTVVPLAQADILAAPLTQRHTYGDVTDAFDLMPSAAGRIRIGLAHGSVAGRLADTIDSSNPIAPDRCARAHLDYLALGDWHGCLSIDARTWYCGTPETDRFRGNDPGYVLDVKISAAGVLPDVERLPVGRYRWTLCTQTIVVPADVDELDRRLADLGANDVIRLELTGAITLSVWDRLKDVVARAEARVRALRVYSDGIRLEPDEHDLAELGVDGYVGAVAAQLQALQQEGARPDALDALGTPVSGISRSDAAREALRLLIQFQRESGGNAQPREQMQ
jgi:DNA repair exonuclease SbcCD nuclease subunit